MPNLLRTCVGRCSERLLESMENNSRQKFTFVIRSVKRVMGKRRDVCQLLGGVLGGSQRRGRTKGRSKE